MNILDSLGAPRTTKAILWDMDGVLIDSLGFDIANCGRILHEVTGISYDFSPTVIEDGFALSPDDFWVYLGNEAQLLLGEAQLISLIKLFEAERRRVAFPVLPGVEATLDAAKASGLRLAVVSNNPGDDVNRILQNCGLFARFEAVLGNDGGTVRKKPFPDTYLNAAGLLGVAIEECVVVEDSLIGAEAGRRSGAFVIGVATGGTSIAELRASGFCDHCLENLEPDLQRAEAISA